MLEQVAHYHAAGRFIDIDPDELRPFVGGAHRAFGQLAANMLGLLVVAVGERLPDLLLARMIVGDRENRAAMSCSLNPFSRRVCKARNWSSGCSAARWTFSASESSSARPSVCTTQSV